MDNSALNSSETITALKVMKMEALLKARSSWANDIDV